MNEYFVERQYRHYSTKNSIVFVAQTYCYFIIYYCYHYVNDPQVEDSTSVRTITSNGDSQIIYVNSYENENGGKYNKLSTITL